MNVMWGIIIVQWLHVLTGIFWFGGTLYLNFVVIPSIGVLSIPDQRKLSERIGHLSERTIAPAATLVILLGLVRGIVFGPVRSVDFLFGTPYGITFFIGFLAAVATYFWGLLVVNGTAKKLSAVPLQADGTFDAKSQTLFNQRLNSLKTLALLELLGFFSIFTCMILMRFGL